MLTRFATLKNEIKSLERQLKEERVNKAKLEERAKDLTEVNNNLKNETNKINKLSQDRYEQLTAKEDEICQVKVLLRTQGGSNYFSRINTKNDYGLLS
jgi:predicted RNase H-like nuclease (RuvC/YqgF family)